MAKLQGRGGWTAGAIVALVLFVLQLAAGVYLGAAAIGVVLLLIAARLFGFSLTGSTAEQRRLDVCPRCGKRDLAPDLDGSGSRHCWACGADVGS
jgi:hypothetical protein